MGQCLCCPVKLFEGSFMRIFRVILFLVASALLIVSVKQFMNGYKAWQEAQQVAESYQKELQRLEIDRDKLKKRVELLKNDTLTKERLVRKKLGYLKPGEVMFKIVKPE